MLEIKKKLEHTFMKIKSVFAYWWDVFTLVGGGGERRRGVTAFV